MQLIIVAMYILDSWFESEPLKATLATDAVIGANISPRMTGSGSVITTVYIMIM